MHVRITLAARRVLEQFHLSKEASDWVLCEIEAKSSKNVTLGVPWLKEITNAATQIKTPSLSVYLKPDVAEESMLAKNVQQELTYTSLCTVTAAMERTESS